MKNFVRSFTFHGVGLELDSDKNLTADCPFCHKEWHFRLNQENGLWQCLKCGLKGNLYTFLRLWWEKCWEETTNPLRIKLSRDRRIRPSTLEAAQFAWDEKNQVWLLPVWKPNGDGKRTMVNLKTWTRDDGKSIFKGTPLCAQHLFNHEGLRRQNNAPLLLCEGEWDALALLDSYGEDGDVPPVIGVPGAHTFKPEWSGLFSGREVWLLYDHDDAGRNGTRIATNALFSSQTPPKSIKALAWPDETPNKYDLRDHLIEHGRESLLPFIEENLVTCVADNLTVHRGSWDKVIGDFRAVYHVDQTFQDAATLVASVALAARVPGDPLWMFLVGPPSTSKTAIVDAFASDREHCETISKMTATQLVSGWKVPGSDEDVSIFPGLRGRTLLVPDYTTIISMPGSAQEELYGIFREAYGGKVRIRYGNGKVVDVEDVYFSMVAAVTDVIRLDSKADLGERFLKVEVIGPEYDSMAVTMSAMNGVVKDATRVRKLQYLGESIKSYLESIRVDLNNLPDIPEVYMLRIANLAQVIGYLRAIIHKEGDNVSFRPRPEGGARVAKQLYKLALCLSLLQKKTRMDEEVFRLIKKAAVDTVWGFPIEICQQIGKFPEGMTTDILVHRLQLGKTNVQRLLGDLQKLGVLHKGKGSNGSGVGRDTHLWFFSPKFKNLWLSAGLTPKDRSQMELGPFKKMKAKVKHG